MPRIQPFQVIALAGDGVGPEVTGAALSILRRVTSRSGVSVEVHEHLVGWAAVQRQGSPLPDETLAACRSADAVFLGAVGHPDAAAVPPHLRPEAALLSLRSTLGCHTNVRPVRVSGVTLEASPLKPERAAGTDLLIVRELAGGIYYGEPRGTRGSGGERHAWNTMAYGAPEIERVARAAFEFAASRDGRVTSVDKANVLEVSRLWREVVSEVASDYPGVRLDHMLVDRAAMEVILNPGTFDVILTANLFGDILSDGAAAVAGSLGLLPSASLGSGVGIFEPVHGSAPDLADRGVANPVGAVLSMAMLLRHGLGCEEPALRVEAAVDAALERGARTRDMVLPGSAHLGTEDFTAAVLEELDRGEAS